MSEPDLITHSAGSRWLKLIGMAVFLALVIVVVLIAPLWLGVLVPTRVRRGAAVVFLDTVLIVYGATLVGATLGLLGLSVALLQTRQPGIRVWLARFLLLCLSGLLGMSLLEGTAAAWRSWSHRAPTLSLPPPPYISRPDDRLPTEFGQDIVAKTNKPTLKILVIGESSARGEPFQPWLSVGQILGWQFERVFAGRRVEVDMQAESGATLEQMHQKLAKLKYRPDLLILFSGHNEYQSRFSWIRYVTYYDFERESKPQVGLIETVLNHSPFCALVLETMDKQRISVRPPLFVTRKLVDRPTCTPEENAQILIDFRKRLEAIATYSETLGTAAVFIAPASNDAGFDPSRSVLPAETSLEEHERFTRDFLDARSVAAANPARGMERLKSIVAAWPGFAEAHYRLAQLYERNRQWDDARRHYVLARELDAMPMRCPEAFREAYRELAARHPSLILVDSSKVLTTMTKHGILGNHEFCDAQHPSLLSYVALSQDALDQLASRKLLGWPEHTAAPRINIEDCALNFRLDREKWKTVCERSAFFYEATAYIRYDPSDRLARQALYEQAGMKLASGMSPEKTGVPGLGTRPAE
jgi:tetratricopeptide (TPR) repeat protein